MPSLKQPASPTEAKDVKSQKRRTAIKEAPKQEDHGATESYSTQDQPAQDASNSAAAPAVYGEEKPEDEPAATAGYESEVSEYDSAEEEAEWEAFEEAKASRAYKPGISMPRLEMLHHDNITWDEKIPHLFTGQNSVESFLIDIDSEEYKKGGEVFRVVVNEEQAIDIMLCETGDCQSCKLWTAVKRSNKTANMPFLHASETAFAEGNMYTGYIYNFDPKPKAYKKTPIHATEDRAVEFKGVHGSERMSIKVCDPKTCEEGQAAMVAKVKSPFNPYADGIIPQFKGRRSRVPVGVPRVSKPRYYVHARVVAKRAMREFKKQEREKRSKDPSVRPSEAYIPGISAVVAAKLRRL